MKNRTKKPEGRDYPMFMTAKQMSAVCGIGENTLRRLMDRGELEYLQVGSHRLICVEGVRDYYERNKTPVQNSGDSAECA